MTRKWIEFKAKAGVDKSERIDALKDKFEDITLQGNLKTHIAQALGFGRSHVYIDTGDTDKPEELKQDIAGRGRLSSPAGRVDRNPPAAAALT